MVVMMKQRWGRRASDSSSTWAFRWGGLWLVQIPSSSILLGDWMQLWCFLTSVNAPHSLNMNVSVFMSTKYANNHFYSPVIKLFCCPCTSSLCQSFILICLFMLLFFLLGLLFCTSCLFLFRLFFLLLSCFSLPLVSLQILFLLRVLSLIAFFLLFFSVTCLKQWRREPLLPPAAEPRYCHSRAVMRRMNDDQDHSIASVMALEDLSTAFFWMNN